VLKRLKLLEQLQEIDLKIDRRKGEREELLREKGGLQQQLDDARLALDERRGEVEGLTSEKESAEENLNAEKENIERSEARLTDIKTQKEYQAVLKEVASAKKVKTELEEQVLQKMSQIDEIRIEAGKMEENLAELEKNLSVRQEEIQGKIDIIEKEMSTQDAEREGIAGALPPSLLNRYAMLRERRQGIAVVEAREGSCLGCNMNIPPQMYNTLYRGEEMLACPHCQRVLFLRREEKNA
jgi:uncharacterized protein